MRTLTHCVVCACVLVLFAGCAVQPVTPTLTILHPASSLDVLELPPTVADDSLRRLFHGGNEKVPAEALAADRRQLEQLVDAALKQALARAARPPLATATITPLNDAAGMTIGQPMNATSLAAQQARFPADAYLRIQATDYGQTPKSWKGAYIGFEVVTTLAIGAWFYTHTVTRALTVPYLAEESVEEFSEGYAGFWLLNRMSRPVRIEADLVDGATGEVLWHDTETGLADWHWKDVWHMDDAMRDKLLKESTDKAMMDLVNELEGK